MTIQRWPAFACAVILVASLSLSTSTLAASHAWAEDAQQESRSSFPGINEVIPRATELSSRMTEAEVIIKQTSSLEQSYLQLSELAEKLKQLEEQSISWEEAASWPLNRLMMAESRYEQLNKQQSTLLELLYKQHRDLEGLRETWTTEKKYWDEWQQNLETSGIEVPQETFAKAQQGIVALLSSISTASAELIKRQEEFSPDQELLASRLVLINKTLDQLRGETFRRNAYSLFSLDFYRQLTPELFHQYRDNIISTIRLPDSFWQNQGWIIILQVIFIIALAGGLLKRSRKPKPISIEWRFLFQHPFAGATFVTLIATLPLYEKIPPSWGWVLLTIGTIAGTALVVSMLEPPLQRRLIIALAFIYLISEALKISGLPTPAYQLYQVLLCALVAPACLFLARRRQKQKPGPPGTYRTSLYLISGAAVIALVTSLFGFATLSTHLIDAILGTIIIFFLARMAIHLADGGITEFLRLNWVRNRQFVRRLGISTADRLKTLARIFIVINAALFLPLVWSIYDSVDEVTTHALSIEYTIGEFTISVYMVVMLLLVLYLTNLISWILQAMADAHFMTPQKMELGVKTAMKRLLHYALFTIGFFVAISMAGLDLQKFTIIAGALGVGIGFGLQNIVNNFVSGLILLFERPVKVGDIINIDEQWGTITRIGLRSTVFETLDRAEIIVPNSELISQKVTNWTFTSNVSRVVLTVGVAYGSPLDKVLDILLRVAKEHPDVLEDPEASAIFTAFGDSSLDFELRAWIPDINKRLKIKSELGQAVDRYFREEGITIPFPQRDLHLKTVETDLKVSLPPQSPE